MRYLARRLESRRVTDEHYRLMLALGHAPETTVTHTKTTTEIRLTCRTCTETWEYVLDGQANNRLHVYGFCPARRMM